jgi:hypothetical protein
MRTLFGLILFTFSMAAFAHPGGGIVALSEDSAVFADPVENFIWLVHKGQEPKRLVSKFHGHWLTRGRDGNLYAEAFQERGGAWPSAAFRLDVPTAKITEIIDHTELGVLTFTVDRDGSLVFQRGQTLVSRRNGKETPFRSSNNLKLADVTAYAWTPEGDLIFADQNRIRRIDPKGATSLITELEGKVLEPKIWNSTDIPTIFGLAVDKSGHVLATVPHLAKVYRIGKDATPREVICSDGPWRATGVSVFGHSIFLMESDSRASTSARVRILRADGHIDTLTVPPPSR